MVCSPQHKAMLSVLRRPSQDWVDAFGPFEAKNMIIEWALQEAIE